jgi:hypothetical protein
VDRQDSFNRFDQLLNVDWLGKEWVPIDMKAGLRLGPRDEGSEEYDRRVVQFRIGSDLRRDFASISFRHYYIKQDQVRPKIPGAQMSPGAVVFLEDQIAARLFEKNFDQVGTVPVVINNQDTSHVVGPESRRR